MFPTGPAVMRPVEPRSDGVELIRTNTSQLRGRGRKQEKVESEGRNRGGKTTKAPRIRSPF